MKTQNNLGIDENFLKLTKGISAKPTANVILAGKILEAFLIKLGPKQECLFSLFLFNTVLESVARAINKEIKGIHFRKEDIKLSVFTADMILHTENSKELI